MEKTVEKIFTEEVMQFFNEKFLLNGDHKKLGDFENYVFEVYQNESPYILRLTHSSHRSQEQLNSEVDWVNYLFDSGLKVPKAHPSIDGNLVESLLVDDGSSFHASLFNKAEGKQVRFSDPDFSEKLFYKWGQTIGRMHKATKLYEPATSIQKRPKWDEDDLLEVDRYIADDEVIERVHQFLKDLNEIPITPENFGLIHNDIHSGNFFYDGDTIQVFDFDDSCYLWFASDIAIPLYYSILGRFPKEKQEEKINFAKTFLHAFVEGYQTSSSLPENWDKHLPLLLRLRDITLFTVLHKKIAEEDRDKQVQNLLVELRARIVKQEPIVNIEEIL
ncbi:phosphotransferase [Radiobacillus kanasensis]|uniref:phosphotransferase enzyme family protein n=1 Tax=Radiobacillus kanasensis TaxID=2844358 RepID=UPI001E6454DD|nr:phosphotransferase [Radiobacillus kanasensis]UFU00438.1 phosphotransferase [Radiobacillus kanasensis]